MLKPLKFHALRVIPGLVPRITEESVAAGDQNSSQLSAASAFAPEVCGIDFVGVV
ncbi:hypothetical protein QO002_000875 [Pararhizobium capsulatum DSM 1112]|uniref:Uncharacterized protein n=1 Tax=Pararhizobium capsulatum DSM 1112 TaxID=1121113 RepID=A0ABU0BL54_9HYPH|nr:hypothetical protein [Pararhizobium capsulatum DSM 1112]